MLGLFRHPDPEDVLTRKQLRQLQRLHNAHMRARKARERAWEKCLGIYLAQGNTKQTVKAREARAVFDYLRGEEMDLGHDCTVKLFSYELKTKTQDELEERLGKNKYGNPKKRHRQD